MAKDGNFQCLRLRKSMYIDSCEDGIKHHHASPCSEWIQVANICMDLNNQISEMSLLIYIASILVHMYIAI